jgi:hypothetical protein
VAPVLVAAFQRFLDQQPAETRAIDEQLAADRATIVQRHRVDETIVAAQRHVDDPPFDPLDAARFGIIAQVAGVEPGIEVEGVGQGAERRSWVGRAPRETPRRRRHRARGVVPDVGTFAFARQLQKELMEAQSFDVVTELTEGVEVAFADLAPVDELDAELERTLRARDEIVLVDAEHLVEGRDRRDGRLADADGTDRLALDQADARAVPDEFRQGGRRHPASGAAADDHDVADAVFVHAPILKPAR